MSEIKQKQTSIGDFFTQPTNRSVRKAETSDIEKPSIKKQKVEISSSSVPTTPRVVPDFQDASYDNLENLIEPSWREQLKDEFTKPYWKQLQEELKKRSSTYLPLSIFYTYGFYAIISTMSYIFLNLSFISFAFRRN